jgi:hypothetical protein
MIEALFTFLREKMPYWFWQLILLLIGWCLWPWLRRRIGWGETPSDRELSPQQAHLFQLFETLRVSDEEPK